MYICNYLSLILYYIAIYILTSIYGLSYISVHLKLSLQLLHNYLTDAQILCITPVATRACAQRHTYIHACVRMPTCTQLHFVFAPMVLVDLLQHLVHGFARSLDLLIPRQHQSRGTLGKLYHTIHLCT